MKALGVLLLAAAASAHLGSYAGAPERVRVVRPEVAPDVLEYRRSLPEARPPLRGFRADTLDQAATKTAFLPDAMEDFALREAVTLVVRELAREGLLPTLVRAVDALDASTIADASRAREAGVPVDLLTYFAWSGADDTRDPDAFVAAVAKRLADGTSVDALIEELASARFSYRPSGFRAASESGERDADTIRVQFTRGDTWLGDGDGGNLDLVRQVANALPEVHVLASVEERHLEELLGTIETWDLADGRITLASEPLVVAQWAQDNGKAGTTADGNTIATLTPRYACRGEGGSTFVPGETFLVDGLAAAGHTIVRSPLLFQGGNLLVANDPAKDERVALVGEAELYRNVALGLSREQALDALRTELGVDRCVVLPAASFHIDAEVTLRSHGGELLAFVNDEDAAIVIVLEDGIDALKECGALDESEATRARTAVANADWMTVIEVVGTSLTKNAVSIGVYPESFARKLETERADPGIANLQTLLYALDRVTARAIPIDQLPDPHAQGYLRSFERAVEDREAIRATLAENGWRVVPVPSLAGGERARNYVNAVHDRTRSLVPAYGGLYERLDRAALDVYEAALGSDVRVIPIRAAESQRRNGTVHCSVALYAAP